jgi:hypothetical protein
MKVTFDDERVEQADTVIGADGMCHELCEAVLADRYKAEYEYAKYAH